ncbi:MAG: type ISP restriction/modification enzyme, partial [Variovorax sp.]|nr:type ISP restriction/modification enzyme [Variovorax sp.]
MHYLRRPELETAEEKLAFLASHPMRGLAFDEVQPDKNANWVNLTNNDFETLLPLASKETKAAKTAAKERAIFKLYGQGLFSGRDEWLYDPSGSDLETRMRFFLGEYEHWLANG